VNNLTLGANTFSYIYTHHAVDAMVRLAEIGFREFELLVAQPHFWAADLSAKQRREVPQQLADKDLTIRSVNIPGIDNNIVSSTREMREFTVNVISQLIDLCGDWHIEYCILVPGRTMPLWPIPKEQLTEWFIEGMNKLATRASDQGVTMLIENVPNTWIPRAEDLMQALDALGRDDVGVIYDVANAPFAGENPVQGIQIVKDKLKLVHLSDTHTNTWRHDPIGMGNVQFAEFYNALRDIDYRGVSMLELVTDDPDDHFNASRKKLVELGWAT